MVQSHLTGIQSRQLTTSRLKHYLLSCGEPSGTPVFFIHGNFSGASYFEELMLAMPKDFYCLAPDLRGYGDSEDKVIDASRGARDWSDDLWALMRSLNISQAHFIGWSAGAAPIMQLAIDHGDAVKSLCLVAPVSPFGFGGSKDKDGKPCHADYSGSGGGTVAKDFIAQLRTQDSGSDNLFSPRNIIRNSYFAKPMIMDREDQLLAVSLKQKLGADRYPGDSLESSHWPYSSPGRFGPINAISAKYFNLSAFADIDNKPPLLWVHGDQDLIISDQSFSDPGHLGAAGLIPNWPGQEVYPAQPMVSQMRFLLQRYGQHHELEMAGVGHSPFIEKPKEFLTALLAFFQAN